jgi:hypothetical protein
LGIDAIIFPKDDKIPFIVFQGHNYSADVETNISLLNIRLN